MIKLVVNITHSEIVDVDDEMIEEYRKNFPDSTEDEMAEFFIDEMIDRKGYDVYDYLDWERLE